MKKNLGGWKKDNVASKMSITKVLCNFYQNDKYYLTQVQSSQESHAEITGWRQITQQTAPNVTQPVCQEHW